MFWVKFKAAGQETEAALGPFEVLAKAEAAQLAHAEMHLEDSDFEIVEGDATFHKTLKHEVAREVDEQGNERIRYSDGSISS